MDNPKIKTSFSDNSIPDKPKNNNNPPSSTSDSTKKSSPPSNLPTDGKDDLLSSLDISPKSAPKSSPKNPEVPTPKTPLSPTPPKTPAPASKPEPAKEENMAIPKPKPPEPKPEPINKIKPPIAPNLGSFIKKEASTPPPASKVEDKTEKKEEEIKPAPKEPSKSEPSSSNFFKEKPQESQSVTIKTSQNNSTLNKIPSPPSFSSQKKSSNTDGIFDSDLSDSSKKQPEEREEPEKEESKHGLKKTILLVTASILLLATAVSAYLYIYRSPAETTPEDQAATGEEDTTATSLEPSSPLTSEQLRLGLNQIPINVAGIEELKENIKAQLASIVEPTQLILQLNNEEIDLATFKSALALEIPTQIVGSSQEFAFVVSKENEIPKAGLVFEDTNSPELTKTQLKNWEATIVQDLNPLLLDTPLADNALKPEEQVFEDSSKRPNSRFVLLSPSQELSLDYSILSDKLIIATSYRLLESLALIVEEPVIPASIPTPEEETLEETEAPAEIQ